MPSSCPATSPDESGTTGAVPPSSFTAGASASNSSPATALFSMSVAGGSTWPSFASSEASADTEAEANELAYEVAKITVEVVGAEEGKDFKATRGVARFGLFSLGIIPAINASIAMQLATVINPGLKKLLREEGEPVRRDVVHRPAAAAAPPAKALAGDVDNTLDDREIGKFLSDFGGHVAAEDDDAVGAGASEGRDDGLSQVRKLRHRVPEGFPGGADVEHAIARRHDVELDERPAELDRDTLQQLVCLA